MDTEKKPVPNYYWSMLANRCPRCRRGPMFKTKSAYAKFGLKNIFNMYDNCPECGQRYDLEPGFWYGTGYVSYALTVAISVASFIAWWVLIGISVSDNRIFYWLVFNALLLVLLQPWLMRFSRSMYMRFFVKYDPDYHKNRPTELS